MKTNVIWVLLLGFALTSCKKDEPVQPSYKDIYGYDYSAAAKPMNGSFFIKKAVDLTFEESDKTDSTATYRITTNGPEPSFTTVRIGGVLNLNAVVLTFSYKTDKAISPVINLDPTKAGAEANLGSMEVSSEWKEYSWDLGDAKGLIANSKWGVVGSYFILTLNSDNPAIPAHIELKNIRFRNRTAAEETFANTGLWLTLTDAGGGSFSNFQDITSQEGGYNLFTRSAYSYKLTNNTNYIRTTDLPRAFLPGEQYHIKFDYKCDIETALLIYVNVPNFVGPAVINPLPAVSGWSTIDYDFTGSIDFPQDSYTANPIQMSFYYPGPESPTMYIRGMHFYLK